MRWFVAVAVLLAGCADDPHRSASVQPALGTTDQIPYWLDWSGSLSEAACVPQGPSACGPGVTLFDELNRHVLDNASLRRSHVDLTVVWTALSPLEETLEVWVGPCHSCEKNSFLLEHSIIVVDSSPLRIQGTLHGSLNDTHVGLLVDTDHPWSPLFTEKTHGRVAFRIHGTFTPMWEAGSVS